MTALLGRAARIVATSTDPDALGCEVEQAR